MSLAGINSSDLLEIHAKEVLAFEEDEAKKLLAIYTRVRKRLLQRIERFKDQFTGQQARVALLQIEAAIRELRESLNVGIGDSVAEMLTKSIEHTASEIDELNQMFLGAEQPLPTQAIRTALTEENFLINKYAASLAAYSDDLRQRIAVGIQEALATRATPDQIVTSLGNFWEREEWRLRRVVRTELHAMYGQGKVRSMRQIRDDFLPDLKKTLYHPLDHRTGDDSVWLLNNQLVVEVGAPFRYEWPIGSGKWRVFDAPPDRPNDRSIVVPYRASWS